MKTLSKAETILMLERRIEKFKFLDHKYNVERKPKYKTLKYEILIKNTETIIEGL